MRYLLDSDAVSVLYDNQRQPHHDTLHGHLARLREEDFVQTSALVLCELEYSYFNAPDEHRSAIRTTISAIKKDFDAILPVDQEVAAVYGEIKAWLGRERRLSRKQMRRHNIDLLLAGTAIVTRATLVGMDQIYDEIAKYRPDLHVERWLVAIPSAD